MPVPKEKLRVELGHVLGLRLYLGQATDECELKDEMSTLESYGLDGDAEHEEEKEHEEEDNQSTPKRWTAAQYCLVFDFRPADTEQPLLLAGTSAARAKIREAL